MNPIKTRILRSNFNNNEAWGDGGAIYYGCEASDTDLQLSSNKPCKLQVSQCDFEGNSADVGGAIRWTFMDIIVSPDSVLSYEGSGAKYDTLTFRNNQANVYGREIAGIAQELIRFRDEETYLQYYDQDNIKRKDIVPIEHRSRFFNNDIV